MMNRNDRSLYVACLLTYCAALPVFAIDDSPAQLTRLECEPSEFEFTGRRQRLQLVVSGVYKNARIADLTDRAEYSVADPTVLEVSATGRARPLQPGATSVLIRFQGLTQTVAVMVRDRQDKDLVSFQYEALPTIAKAGCSGGSCHGSPNGKAGFRLSLFASDPDLDRFSLVRHSLGRRVNRLEPEQSLLLLKPSMQTPHGGGMRLARGSESYALLRDWIAEGCPTNEDDNACVGIQVTPGEARLLQAPDWSQQLRVSARFADGSRRDVTHLAQFSVSDDQVANVSPDGRVEGLQRGESAVVVRFREFIETPIFTFGPESAEFAWKTPPAFNYIDEHVDEKLRQLQYLPSAVCKDEEFVRRVYLDVIGLLPSPEETDRFLGDSSADKRSKLIDALLERPEYARFWAQKWGDVLRVSRKLLGLQSVHKYNRWLQTSVSANQPYDEFVGELITATGSTLTHPAGNYYRTAADTNDAMETTLQLFLGTRIQCAKCHNHPFERWTQDHYYGLAAFFNRVQRKKTNRPEEIVLWSSDSGEVMNPRTNRAARPWTPGRGEMPIDGKRDRREAFLEWLTAEDNLLFAKVGANRLWGQLLGRGIVEPVDDFRDSNPPSNAGLLDALAKDFIRSRYDEKHMLRTILNSRTYQSSSQANASNREDTRYFSHYIPRRLSAEQIVDAMGQVTGSPKEFELVAMGSRATWLPAPDLKPGERAKIGEIEFLKVFGQPERQSVCECERGDDTSLGQALQLLNGKFVHDMLTDPKTDFRREIESGTTPRDVLVELYTRALCRPPTDKELTAGLAYFAAQSDKRLAMEDLCWAIVNKSEFLFQH